MNSQKATQVKSYFDRSSKDWDEIYSGAESPFTNWLNRRFRPGVYNRAKRVLETLQEEREHVHQVLDIGCGSGRVSLQIAEMGFSVCGIDFAQNMIEIGERFAREVELDDLCSFIHADFMEYPFQTKSFSASIALGVFDYIADPKSFLDKMKLVTSYVMMATFPLAGTLRSRIRKIRLALNKCPVYFYERERLTKIFDDLGVSQYQIERVNNQYMVIAKK